MRARAISAGNVPDVATARLKCWRIFQRPAGRYEGWHCSIRRNIRSHHSPQTGRGNRASGNGAWRTALWHWVGSRTVRTEGAGPRGIHQELSRWTSRVCSSPMIEQLYRSINGSLDGLEKRLGGTGAVTVSSSRTRHPNGSDYTPAPPVLSTWLLQKLPIRLLLLPAPSQSPPRKCLTRPLRAAASRVRSNIRIMGRVVDSIRLDWPMHVV